MAELTIANRTSLENALGYTFSTSALLSAALIHTSYANERPDGGLEANERLEFLGDAVLGVVAAHRLYERRPDSHEGELTVLRAWLVRESTLARWAAEIGLGEYLQVGRGEGRTGGRQRPAILARAFESVLGAAYLDGGLGAAQQILDPFIERELEGGHTPQKVVDPKSRLQQVAQAQFGEPPRYQLLDTSGPGHAPRFVFQVDVGPEVAAQGEGASKRAAQQAAAQAALRFLAAGDPDFTEQSRSTERLSPGNQ